MLTLSLLQKVGIDVLHFGLLSSSINTISASVIYFQGESVSVHHPKGWHYFDFNFLDVEFSEESLPSQFNPNSTGSFKNTHY